MQCEIKLDKARNGFYGMFKQLKFDGYSWELYLSYGKLDTCTDRLAQNRGSMLWKSTENTRLRALAWKSKLFALVSIDLALRTPWTSHVETSSSRKSLFDGKILTIGNTSHDKILNRPMAYDVDVKLCCLVVSFSLSSSWKSWMTILSSSVRPPHGKKGAGPFFF